MVYFLVTVLMPMRNPHQVVYARMFIQHWWHFVA